MVIALAPPRPAPPSAVFMWQAVVAGVTKTVNLRAVGAATSDIYPASDAVLINGTVEGTASNTYYAGRGFAHATHPPPKAPAFVEGDPLFVGFHNLCQLRGAGQAASSAAPLVVGHQAGAPPPEAGVFFAWLPYTHVFESPNSPPCHMPPPLCRQLLRGGPGWCKHGLQPG